MSGWVLLWSVSLTVLILQVKEEFHSAEEKGCPVAGLVVEPVQAEGGEWVREWTGRR